MSDSLLNRIRSVQTSGVGANKGARSNSSLRDLKKNIKISSQEIELLSKYIYSISGIYIESSKAYLLETRLGKLLEIEKCHSYAELYYKSKADKSKSIKSSLLRGQIFLRGYPRCWRVTFPCATKSKSPK